MIREVAVASRKHLNFLYVIYYLIITKELNSRMSERKNKDKKKKQK
ncbi:uncharacterized protein PRCAT00002390001 [Priceomyces carsonii]|nr:unnamed protein product [Priceomyces carsonii]